MKNLLEAAQRIRDKEIADKLAALEANRKDRPAPIDNTELVLGFRAEGGGVLHIRPFRDWDGKWTRGLTAAFKIKGRRVEIATALTHHSDCFTKKMGTKLAIEHFRAGKTVFLPVSRDNPVLELQRALRLLV